MKKQTPTLQIAILGLSSFIVIAAVIFFAQSASELSSTSLLESNLSDDLEKVATPVNYETRLAKGDALYQSGFYSLAATEYAFAINIQEENPTAHLKLGHSYMQLGEFNKAAAQYQTALEHEPGDTNTQTLYGTALIRNGQFQEAQSVFDSFTQEVQEAQYYGALLDALNGRHETAIKKLHKAKSLEGPITQDTLNRFLANYDVFNEQQDGQNVYLQTLLAESLIDEGEYQLAEALALDVLSIKSDYRDAWILLGYTKLKIESYQDAEDAFTQAKKLDAIKPETHYFLATAHYFQEEYEAAITEYELGLLYGFKPELEAYQKIAESQLFLEKYDDALAAYEHLVKIDHSNVELFVRPVWIAITYVQDLDRALTLAEDAVDKFPKSAMSHNLLAWAHTERNELELADQDINNSFRLNPDLAEAHYNAGLLREKQNNKEGAKWEYKKAHELSQAGDSISALAAERYNQLIQEETTPNETAE